MAICRKILRQVDNFHFFSDLTLSVDHLAKNDENLSKKSLLPFSTYIISMTTNNNHGEKNDIQTTQCRRSKPSQTYANGRLWAFGTVFHLQRSCRCNQRQQESSIPENRDKDNAPSSIPVGWRFSADREAHRVLLNP